jgi:hypothetical protein
MFSAPISDSYSEGLHDMPKPTTFAQSELDSLANTKLQVSGRPAVRFMQTCVDYYNEWLDANSASVIAGTVPAGQALLLIYAEMPSVNSGVPDAACTTSTKVFRSTCALDNGAAVCNENLHEMLKIVPSFVDANDAMLFIAKHLTAEHSFALLLLTQNRMLLHDAGLELDTWINEPRTLKIDRSPPAVITPDLIVEQLNTFHIESTAQPGGVAARLMWKIDEKAAVLDTSPELRVQSSLLPFLRGAFRHAGAVVDEEIKLPGGRVDIRIVRHDNSKPPKSTSTMVELKVLNPDHPDKKNLAWAIKGVDQAVKYASYDTDKSLACIYDARRSKVDTMPSLSAHADAQKVKLLLYPMEVPQPKAARKIKAASAATVASAAKAKSLKAKTKGAAAAGT